MVILVYRPAGCQYPASEEAWGQLAICLPPELVKIIRTGSGKIIKRFFGNTNDMIFDKRSTFFRAIFRVFDAEVQSFIGHELPGLVDRLTGFKFQVNQAECVLDAPAAPQPPARAVRPTTSLDLKA